MVNFCSSYPELRWAMIGDDYNFLTMIQLLTSNIIMYPIVTLCLFSVHTS